MKLLHVSSSSLLHRRILLAIAFTGSLGFLASCGNDVAATPTPLAVLKLNGNWTLTPNNSPNPGVTNMAGALANEHGDGASISLPTTANLTITGSCMSDQAPPASLTGTVTNPRDVSYEIQLSGPIDGGTLTIDGLEQHNTNVITGSYTITGGPCQTTNASFTATRDGTNGSPEPATTWGAP